MKRLFLISSCLFLLIILFYAGNRYKEPVDQVTKTKTIKVTNSMNKDFTDKDFKAKNTQELSAQDFVTAYRLGETFLKDYYSQFAGNFNIDFSKYIENGNLLKYSNRKILINKKRRFGIKEISIGLAKAQFDYKEKCFYFNYAIDAKFNYDSGFGEGVEILISNANGNLVVSDWYIRWGAGSNFFDESFRPNAIIKSPKIWDNHEFVSKLFKKVGIE